MNDYLIYFHEKNTKMFFTSQWIEYNKNINYKFKFNFPTIFFGGYWLIYRKMYFYGLIFIICEALILFFINNYFEKNAFLISLAIFLPVRIFLGFYINKIYIIYASKKILSCPYDDSQNENRSSWIAKEGGTDIFTVIIFIVIYNLLSFKALLQKVIK